MDRQRIRNERPAVKVLNHQGRRESPVDIILICVAKVKVIVYLGVVGVGAGD